MNLRPQLFVGITLYIFIATIVAFSLGFPLGIPFIVIVVLAPIIVYRLKVKKKETPKVIEELG